MNVLERNSGHTVYIEPALEHGWVWIEILHKDIIYHIMDVSAKFYLNELYKNEKNLSTYKLELFFWHNDVF